MLIQISNQILDILSSNNQKFVKSSSKNLKIIIINNVKKSNKKDRHPATRGAGQPPKVTTTSIRECYLIEIISNLRKQKMAAMAVMINSFGGSLRSARAISHALQKFRD